MLLTAASLGGAGLAYWHFPAPSGLSLRGVVLDGSAEAAAPDLSRATLAVALTAIGDTAPEKLPWNWGEGVLLLGLQRAAAWTGDARIHDYLSSYYSFHQRRGISVSWSDDTTPALALTERLLLGRTAGAPLAQQVVDYVMSAPRSRQGMLLHLGNTRVPFIKDMFPDVWIDSIFHVVPTLFGYGELRSDPRLRDEALRQLLLFIRNLQDPRTGLFAHGYHDEDPERQVPPFLTNTFWARGNGWMLATMVDALRRLPQEHPQRPELVLATRRVGLALRAVQDASGLFHTLLTDPATYFESAGSALIIYGLSAATSLGIIPGSIEEQRRDHRALLAMLRQEGSRTVVTGTSLGTNPVRGLYALTPTADQVSYGVGAWLMAATQLLRSDGDRGGDGSGGP